MDKEIGVFSYDFKDFLQEKLWKIPEWVLLIFYIFYSFISSNNIITAIFLFFISTIAVYWLVRWKRHQFYNNGVKEWKTIGGLLVGANGALFVIGWLLTILFSIILSI